LIARVMKRGMKKLEATIMTKANPSPVVYADSQVNVASGSEVAEVDVVRFPGPT